MVSQLRQPVPVDPRGLTRDTKTRICPELVLIPLVVSLKYSISYPLQIGIFAIIGLFALMRFVGCRKRSPTEGGGGSFAYVPSILIMVMIALTFRVGEYRTALVFAAVTAILLLLAGSITRDVAYDSILAGMMLYVVANVAGWAAGITNTVGVASRIGAYETNAIFFSERVFFPFQTSLNESPYIAAAVVVSALALLKLGRRPRWFHWVAVLAALVILDGTNSRAPLAFAVLLALGIWLAPNVLRAAAPLLVSGALLLPLYISQAGVVITFLRESALGGFVSRAGSGGGSFDGRQDIWQAGLVFWTQHFPGLLKFAFGYGYQGQVTSGLTYYFPLSSSLFLRDRRSLHLHNSPLQLMMDTGFLGAAILVIVSGFMLFRYSQAADLLPILVAAVMIVLSGVFEVNLTPGWAQAPVFILLCLAFFTPTKERVGNCSRPSRTADDE